MSDKFAWNSTGSISRYPFVNMQMHGDHHTNPSRSYQSLTISSSAPVLPFSNPIMFMLALIPPLFFRIMNPRVLSLGESHESELTSKRKGLENDQLGKISQTAISRQFSVIMSQGQYLNLFLSTLERKYYCHFQQPLINLRQQDCSLLRSVQSGLNENLFLRYEQIR